MRVTPTSTSCLTSPLSAHLSPFTLFFFSHSSFVFIAFPSSPVQLGSYLFQRTSPKSLLLPEHILAMTSDWSGLLVVSGTPLPRSITEALLRGGVKAVVAPAGEAWAACAAGLWSVGSGGSVGGATGQVQGGAGTGTGAGTGAVAEADTTVAGVGQGVEAARVASRSGPGGLAGAFGGSTGGGSTGGGSTRGSTGGGGAMLGTRQGLGSGVAHPHTLPPIHAPEHAAAGTSSSGGSGGGAADLPPVAVAAAAAVAGDHVPEALEPVGGAGEGAGLRLHAQPIRSASSGMPRPAAASARGSASALNLVHPAPAAAGPTATAAAGAGATAASGAGATATLEAELLRFLAAFYKALFGGETVLASIQAGEAAAPLLADVFVCFHL